MYFAVRRYNTAMFINNYGIVINFSIFMTQRNRPCNYCTVMIIGNLSYCSNRTPIYSFGFFFNSS